MIRKVKKFIALKRQEKALFFEALMLSYWIWLKHFFYKFSSLEKKYMCKGTGHSQNVAQQIHLAIKRSAHMTFWKNKCLIQSFVARKMLNRRNLSSEAFLGLSKAGEFDYKAHAWVISSDVEVIAKGVDFTTVHSF